MHVFLVVTLYNIDQYSDLNLSVLEHHAIP